MHKKLELFGKSTHTTMLNPNLSSENCGKKIQSDRPKKWSKITILSPITFWENSRSWSWSDLRSLFEQVILMWSKIAKKVIGHYFANFLGPKYWPITFFEICDHIKITCSKSDLRSDQDHDLEFSQKVIGDKIAILDHFLSQSLWIFLPQFSEHRFRFNIVVWVLFPNNLSFFLHNPCYNLWSKSLDQRF